jgi:hypothetical protein
VVDLDVRLDRVVSAVLRIDALLDDQVNEVAGRELALLRLGLGDRGLVLDDELRGELVADAARGPIHGADLELADVRRIDPNALAALARVPDRDRARAIRRDRLVREHLGLGPELETNRAAWPSPSASSSRVLMYR